jgi:hypothetical protein
MSQQVLPDNQEDREVYLREHNAGKFIAAVNDVQAKQLDTVMLTIGAFAGEPDLLYVALDYASASDITVTVAPLLKRG